MIQDRCFENSGEEPTPSLPPREKIGSIERISAHLARFEGDGKKNAVVNPATRCVSRYFTSGVEGRGEFHSSGKSWREKLASSPPAPRSRFSHNLSLTMMPSDRQLFARGRKISAPSVDIPLHPSLLRREQPPYPCHESPSSSLFRINNYHHPRIQRKFRRRMVLVRSSSDEDSSERWGIRWDLGGHCFRRKETVIFLASDQNLREGGFRWYRDETDLGGISPDLQFQI